MMSLPELSGWPRLAEHVFMAFRATLILVKISCFRPPLTVLCCGFYLMSASQLMFLLAHTTPPWNIAIYTSYTHDTFNNVYAKSLFHVSMCSYIHVYMCLYIHAYMLHVCMNSLFPFSLDRSSAVIELSILPHNHKSDVESSFHDITLEHQVYSIIFSIYIFYLILLGPSNTHMYSRDLWKV